MEQTSTEHTTPAALQIAEAIRAACIAVALDSYEDASMRGLCHEGAWECAVGAMRTLNLQALLAEIKKERGES
jgi:hypothetical protein